MVHGVVNWHLGRCGSSVLGSLLAQHSAIDYSNEIYSPYMPRRIGKKQLPALTDVVKAARDSLFRPYHLFEVKHLAAQNLGLYPELQLWDWLTAFHEMGYRRHLLMGRRNGLRRMVSHVRAAQTGVYVDAGKSSASAQTSVTLPMQDIVHGFQSASLLEWLEEYESGHQAIRSALIDWSDCHADVAWLELIYEDDVESSPLSAYERVCEFLGINFQNPRLTHRRINHGALADLVTNFEEVRHLLQPTRFAWMLED